MWYALQAKIWSVFRAHWPVSALGAWPVTWKLKLNPKSAEIDTHNKSHSFRKLNVNVYGHSFPSAEYVISNNFVIYWALTERGSMLPARARRLIWNANQLPRLLASPDYRFQDPEEALNGTWKRGNGSGYYVQQQQHQRPQRKLFCGANRHSCATLYCSHRTRFVSTFICGRLQWRCGTSFALQWARGTAKCGSKTLRHNWKKSSKKYKNVVQRKVRIARGNFGIY